MQDLASLKIDRTRKPVNRRRKSGAGRWVFRILALLLLAGIVTVFHRPITGFIDRIRLPRVQVTVVERSHPAAAGAVQGTAANGHIVAARRAALSADTPGRIVEMHVTEGTVLKKGDVVARLFADEYAAALAQAKADEHVAAADVERAKAARSSAAAAKRRRERGIEVAAALLREAQARQKLAAVRFERAQQLFERGVSPADAVDAARAEMDGADARVDSAIQQHQAAVADAADSAYQEEVATAALAVAAARVSAARSATEQAAATLGKTVVRAPFDGIVVLKDAEVGEVVSPNSQGGSNARGSVCTMVDFDSLEVQAEVPETSLGSVRIGAAAAIYLDAYPGRAYQGTVSRIWPTANRQKASIEVRVRFAARDADLRPEMGVRVVFLPDDAAAVASGEVASEILVPQEAVVEIDGKPGAFVVERGAVHFQQIGIGNRRAGQVNVLSGLRPGQRIVLAPPMDLVDGSRVQIATH